MAENTKGVEPTTKGRNEEDTREKIKPQEASPASASTGTDQLDEKSSAMGRRDKNTGLSTKDGLTGSDLDGQTT